MSQKRYTAEQIIGMLREAEVCLSQGQKVSEVCRGLGITDQTCYRSDNGGDRQWLAHMGVRTLYIEPASPWENGYNERFNGKLRDELLNGEIFYTLREPQVMIERWRQQYNTIRPHSALGYRPPAPETILPPSWGQVTPQGQNYETLT